jgi:peptidoglycan hydrolase-like protein with peptidoglycan-binding domain
VVAVFVGVGALAYAIVWHPDPSSAGSAAAPFVDTPSTRQTTTTRPPATTTTTTIPPFVQPSDMLMPSPGSGLSYGSQGGIVQLYEARMKQLHFDPGPVDGSFDQQTQYAVVSVQKYFGQPRTGVIDRAVQLVLSHFRYSPAKPKSEPDRVEIDLDRQVLTTFKNWQPILVTTTSTGSGAYFCGGVDGCQYAVTPPGQYHFYSLYRGWDEGKLGRMWNPYYFNGGIAVHGLASVPSYPASHGCARIPMWIAQTVYAQIGYGSTVYVYQ